MTPCPSCGAPFTPSLPDQTVCDACAGLHPPEESSPLQQSRVGDYTLAHELGAGRFSTSWLAEQQSGGGVVLKLLRAYAPDEGTVQAFLAEASRLSQPGAHEHPGLARVLEAGVHIGGALFLVYESGGELTLADELRARGRLLPGRAVALCAQLCEGLAALHGAGLLHQGLKPANVGLAKEADGAETAVLLDAFTAHLLGRAGLRETGMLPISTAAYLSPEGARGDAAGPAADLYAIGVLLFQLISGRLPVMGSTSEELVQAHQHQRALRLRDVGRKVHPDLEAVLARLLAKDPAARFPDAESAAQALRSAQTDPVEGAQGEAEEEVEDPVPILSSEGGASAGGEAGEGAEPEVMPPKPERAPEPIDPALEQAMLGHLPPGEDAAPQPVEPAPRPVPQSVWRSTFPEWLTPLRAGAAAAVLCAATVAALFAFSGPARARKVRASSAKGLAAPPPVTSSATPPTGTREATAPIATAVPDLEPDPVAAAEPAPKPPPAAKKAAKAPAPAPAKKVAALTPPAPPSRLGAPQRLLSKGDPEGAAQALDTLLAGQLSAADRAQATRLMAEAQALAGDKPAAVSWYRKYLQLAGSADERARVVKKIAELNR